MKAEPNLENYAISIFCKARTVTYALCVPVNEDLQWLKNGGILKPVTSSKLATRIIPVHNTNWKICVYVVILL